MNHPKPFIPSSLFATLFALIFTCAGTLAIINNTHAAESGDGSHAEGGHTGNSGGGHSGGGGSGHEPGGGSGGHEEGGGHESGGHASGGGKGKHGSGGSKGGHASGEHPEGDDHEDSGDHGQRGPGSGFKGGGARHVPSGIEDPGSSTESEGRGPRYGGGGSKPEPGTQGGPPSWAKEGIPHVELGRLNVARSPDSVLQRAYDEVLSNWNPELANFYSQSAADAATFLSANYSTVTRVDSPLGNLGIYKHLMADGQTQLPDVTPYSSEDLAAIALGSASDKNLPISIDTVKALNIILGVGKQLTESQIADIASKADSVRSAIQTGHGE